MDGRARGRGGREVRQVIRSGRLRGRRISERLIYYPDRALTGYWDMAL